MASPFQRLKSSLRDVFDANTEADKRRRIAQGKPAEYRDEVAQRRGVLPRLYGNIQTSFQDDTQQLKNSWRSGESRLGALGEFYVNRTGIGGLNKRLYDNPVTGSFLEGAGNSLVNMSPQRIAGSGAEYIGRATGNEKVKKWGENITQPFREYNTQSYDERLKNGRLNRFAYQGGSMAGTLLGSTVNPTGKIGIVTRGAQFGLPAAADTSKYIEQSGGDRRAQIIGGATSGITQGTMGNLLKGKGTGVVRIGTSALAGGTENTAQQLIDNLIAQKTYNPDRKLTESLLPAFVMGGAMSGLTAAGNKQTARDSIEQARTAQRRGEAAGNVHLRALNDDYDSLNKRWQIATPTGRKYLQKAIQANRNEFRRITEGGYISGGKEERVYRGVNPERYGIGEARLGRGLYTGSKEIAGRLKNGEVITDGLYEYKVNPKSRILDTSTDEFRALDAEATRLTSQQDLDGRSWQDFKAQALTSLVRKRGYDAVRNGTTELVAMSDNVLIPQSPEAPVFDELQDPEYSSLLDTPEGRGGVVIQEAKHPAAGTTIQRGIKLNEKGKPVQFERTVPNMNKLSTDEPQLPVMDQPQLKTLDEGKESFVDLTNQYLGSQKAGQIGATDRAKLFNQQFGALTEKQKNEVIFGTDDPTFVVKDPLVNSAIDYLHKEYDDAYNYFKNQKGLRLGYQQDYYPRQYKNTKTGAEITAAEYRLLQTGSQRMKGRTGAELQEWKLITRDPAEAMQKYYSSLERASAGQKYLKQLEMEGLVMSSSEPVRGMQPVVAEGMQQDGMIYYARPDVAKKLNTIFGSHDASGFFEKTLEKAQGFNSFVQSFVLSGGIPNTPLNSFGMMQLMKNGMALHPIQGARAFITGLSRNDATRFFDRNASYLKIAAENGLDIRYDYSLTPNKGMVRIKKAGEDRGVSGVIGTGWNELTNDATFGRFMPALEVLHFKGVYDGLTRKGIAPEVAGRTAADATANFFGKNSMAKDAMKSKVAKDFMGATFFAPRFRESMVNFWVKNAQALDPRGGFKNARSIEYRDNLKFMAAAAATYAAMDAINYAVNGTHMYENPDGKKDKLLLPGGDATDGKYIGIPFLPSIATVPRNVGMMGFNALTGNFEEAGKNLKSFFSMPIQTGGEVLTNEDYFGSQIYDKDGTAGQKLVQTGAYVLKDNTQPWIREGLNALGQNLPEDTKKLVGINKQSGLETLSKATESPLRFYNPEYFRGGNESFAGKTGEKTISIKKDGKRVSLSDLPEYEQYLELAKYNKDGKKLTTKESSDFVDQQMKKVGKSAASEVNSWRQPDWPAVKESTRVTEAWAKYKKDKAEGKVSALEDSKTRRSIIKDAYMDQIAPGTDIRDIYSLSTNDKILAIENGLVTKETFDKVIELDNFFYKTGLSTELEVSKTLRSKLGYASPASKSGSGKKASKPAALNTVNILKGISSTRRNDNKITINKNKIVEKSKVAIKKKA